MPKRNYTQAGLDDAVNRVKLGELSQRQAAAQYGIPRSTIFDKVSGRRPPQFCPMGRSPYLSMAEEAKIASWAIKMSKIGYGRTKPQILQIVQQIIKEDGRPTPFKDDKPGRKWFSSFMKRNPQLSLRTPQALGQERAVLTVEKVERWFSGLRSYLTEENALSILEAPNRMWNADESGFALSPTGEKVLGMKGSKFVYQFSATTRTNLTTLEAASASGLYCPPFVVYPGKRVSRNWNPLDGAPEDWFFGFSDSGWMNAELFYSWLVNHFHPYLLSLRINFPVLLLVDGHASHVDLHVAEFCQQHNIILYRLVAHASHVIQPLDLSLFGPLKKAYRRHEGEWKDAHPGQFVTKPTFAGVFAKAWKDMRPDFAKSGFRSAGLFPFTGDFCRDKLAPAQMFTIAPAAPPAPPAPPAHDDPSTSTAGTSTGRPEPATTPQVVPPSITTPSISGQLRSITAQTETTPVDETIATPTRRPAGCPIPPGYVTPISDKYLVYPEARRNPPKKRAFDELPNGVSHVDFIAHQRKKKNDQEEEEEKKRKRKEEREAKKAEKLEMQKKKGGKKLRKEPRQNLVDETVCSECDDDFDDEYSNCVGCNHCPRWYHVQCTELIGLTAEEVEATDFTCVVCSEE